MAINNLINDLEINDSLYKLSITNDNNIEYCINTVHTNDDFIGNYFSKYRIELEINDEREAYWIVNGKINKEKNIEIDLYSDTELSIISK